MRARVAVIDANAFWTERLFAACGREADVLLIKPREARAHRARHGRWRGDREPVPVAEGVWQQRLAMPPRWMSALWPWSRRRLAGAASRHLAGAPGSLVLTYPQYQSIARSLPGAKLVYYNMDDYTDNWPRLATRMRALEEGLVRAADLTVCIAGERRRVLCERVAEARARICHIPIGCSPELMVEDVLRAPRALPRPLAALPRPVVGHVGALNWRFDFALLGEVARALPRVSFLLGGDVPRAADGGAAWWRGVRACVDLPNVHFVGRVPHEALGRWLTACDALLMCYSDTRFNRNACPAKLWDYLGTSLPIVANDVVPEVCDWAEHVYLAGDGAALAAAIERALAEDREARGAARLAVARAHTWTALAERLGAAMASAGTASA